MHSVTEKIWHKSQVLSTCNSSTGPPVANWSVLLTYTNGLLPFSPVCLYIQLCRSLRFGQLFVPAASLKQTVLLFMFFPAYVSLCRTQEPIFLHVIGTCQDSTASLSPGPNPCLIGSCLYNYPFSLKDGMKEPCWCASKSERERGCVPCLEKRS